MSSNAAKPGGQAIRVDQVSKHYTMYGRPEDRFKQMIVPRAQRLLGRTPRQYFRNFAALHDISFEVGRGETVGIIGRNGSGKSTLLQIICGTLQPTSGSVEVNGRIAALLELGAGFNPEFTGRENVFLNASILGVPRQEMEWRFDDIARFADIGPFLDQPVKTYSSGMYVRLAFATAINVDPDILVVDEALSVGDEAFQRKCFARIEEIKDKGGTILFVSHGAQTIVQLCTRAILIDAGEKVLEGRPKTVVGQYQRLINAQPAAAAVVRAEIIQMRDAGTALGSSVDDMNGNTSVEPPQKEAAPQEATAEPRKERPADFYDPNLTPLSTITYSEYGGKIEDLRITRPDGTQVNVLVPNGVYNVRYRVTFTEDFDSVGFACMMKTVEGLELSGQTSHTLGKGHKVVSGETVEITFPFRANVLGGMHFFNAGVYVSSKGEFRQIHRIVEGVAFRILAEIPTRGRMGLVDLVPEDEHAPIVRKIGEVDRAVR